MSSLQIGVYTRDFNVSAGLLMAVSPLLSAFADIPCELSVVSNARSIDAAMHSTLVAFMDSGNDYLLVLSGDTTVSDHSVRSAIDNFPNCMCDIIAFPIFVFDASGTASVVASAPDSDCTGDIILVDSASTQALLLPRSTAIQLLKSFETPGPFATTFDDHFFQCVKSAGLSVGLKLDTKTTTRSYHTLRYGD